MAPPHEIPFAAIRERAHELWDRNHRPDGLDVQFWLLAERELRAELARAHDGDGEHGEGAPAEGSRAQAQQAFMSEATKAC